MARITSLGFRFINTAPLLNRGGICYVATVASQLSTPSAAGLTEILASTETKQFDIGQLPEMGDEFTWTPLQLKAQENEQAPTDEDTPGIPEMLPNFLTYQVPGSDMSMADNALFLLVQVPASDDGGVSLNLEIGINFEGVPFPQNEYLFDREIVVGSEDDLAVAAELQAAESNKSSATASSFGPAESDVLGSVIRGGISGIGGGVKGVLGGAAKGFLSQVPSLLSGLVKTLGKAAGGLSMTDYQNHQLAIHLDAHQVSPLISRKNRGLPRHLFLAALLDYLASKEGTPESKESGFPPPPALTRQVAGVPAVSQPSVAASAQPTPRLYTDSLGDQPWTLLATRARSLSICKQNL